MPDEIQSRQLEKKVADVEEFIEHKSLFLDHLDHFGLEFTELGCRIAVVSIESILRYGSLVN
jgi:hypothetical protein